MLFQGENFKEREKIRNSIAHGNLTRLKGEDNGINKHWFEDEFILFLKAIVKILNPDIDKTSVTK